MFKNSIFEHQDGYVTPVAQPQVGIGVHIDLFEVDAERAKLGRHLLAEMAALAAVQPSLCR